MTVAYRGLPATLHLRDRAGNIHECPNDARLIYAAQDRGMIGPLELEESLVERAERLAASQRCGLSRSTATLVPSRAPAPLPSSPEDFPPK